MNEKGVGISDTSGKNCRITGSSLYCGTIGLSSLQKQIKAGGYIGKRVIIELENLDEQEYQNLDEGNIIAHIGRIRKKVETDAKQPRYIQTVRGVGYKFTK